MKIEPAASIEGAVGVPGVKGISQRAVLLGAIADGESLIEGFGRAADTETAISVVRQLGAEVDEDGPETVRVRGVGLRGLREPEGPLDFGNAGTVMRLASGILAGQEGRFELVGDESLSSRPQERIAEPLRQMGASVETTDGHAPVVIEGGRLSPIRYELPVASAQVKSAVLLAGLLADGGPTRVVEPQPTRDHTERLLRELGVAVGAPGLRDLHLARRAAALGAGADRGRLLLGGAARARGDAAERLGAARAGREHESAADGLPRRARADGREDRRLQPAAGQRRAGRRPRGAVGAS